MKRYWLLPLIIGCILCLFGCQKSEIVPDNWLLVSFEENVPITYKMIANRKTEIDLTTSDPEKKSRPQHMTETLEMVMVYTPIEVDPFGLSTVEVTCKSVSVSRSGFSGRQKTVDTMENLKGQTFVLKLSPTGQLEDYSDLERIAKELGEKAFTSGKNNARIKNPDMISDFLALQQLLWDASSTISNQLKLDVGDSWQAKQPIAWPVPMYPPRIRMTTYTLDSITEDPSRKALITSTSILSEGRMETYILPYEEGKYQMRGLFGFLRNYRFKHLEGSGRQVFNIDDGLVESDQQQYLLNVEASFMLPLGDSVPILTVEQTFSIERIQTPE